MQKVIVTGGCGYIGSHTVVDLIKNGFEVISIDNLSRSNQNIQAYIEKITTKPFLNYKVDLCDKVALDKVFSEHPDTIGVIHFAAYKSVPESVDNPLLYYRNNLDGLCNLLDCMSAFAVKHLIFSSSCSVYGNTDRLPVLEETPMLTAESPYAATKQMGERIISDFTSSQKDFNSILLRYFNPAGAHITGQLGEFPNNAVKNLVPILMDTVKGKRDHLIVHGSDYPTRDGTCIRDYIHIMDLADAHTKSLHYLISNQNNSSLEVFNVGIGKGVTVLEAIRATEKATGIPVKFILGPRRKGDVQAIYADYSKAKNAIGWTPQFSIDDIMASAWKWENFREEKA